MTVSANSLMALAAITGVVIAHTHHSASTKGPGRRIVPDYSQTLLLRMKLLLSTHSQRRAAAPPSSNIRAFSFPEV